MKDLKGRKKVKLTKNISGKYFLTIFQTPPPKTNQPTNQNQTKKKNRKQNQPNKKNPIWG